MTELTELLDASPALIHQRFPGLDFGATGARMLTLRGGTLLHVAAEFQSLDAARLLLDRGGDVNAAAMLDETGVGGQTPIFHAATQGEDAGLPLVQLLVERGADLTVRARLPGHYEAPGEVVECTPLDYALLFPGDQGATSAYLKGCTDFGGRRPE
jgi:ankyrin repeat protein